MRSDAWCARSAPEWPALLQLMHWTSSASHLDVQCELRQRAHWMGFQQACPQCAAVKVWHFVHFSGSVSFFRMRRVHPSAAMPLRMALFADGMSVNTISRWARIWFWDHALGCFSQRHWVMHSAGSLLACSSSRRAAGLSVLKYVGTSLTIVGYVRLASTPWPPKKAARNGGRMSGRHIPNHRTD
jgi:hypothetical protein